MNRATLGTWVGGLLVGGSAVVAGAVRYGSVRNGGLDVARERRPSDQSVLSARQVGWTLPQDLRWPAHWEPNPATRNGVLRFLPRGGMAGNGAVSLDRHGHLSSYFGRAEPGRPYVAAIRLTGKGTFWYSVYRYGEDGFISTHTAITRAVDTTQWREYRGLFANDDPRVRSINLAVSGIGNVVIDAITFQPADLVDVEMTTETIPLYGTGALIEDLSVRALKRDGAFAEKLADLVDA